MESRVLKNLKEIRALGLPVFLRHLGRLRPDRKVTVKVPGVGSIHLRSGDSDFGSVRQVFVYREYDLAFVTALDARVRARYEAILAAGETPIIADIGANIGAASLWFAAQFPNAKIVAVEPDPGNFALLRQNAAGNPAITVVEAAIGAEPGYVALESSGDQSWAIRTVRAERGVPVLTMDGVIDAAGGGTPFLAKIDIEGFEAELFGSNLAWIEGYFVVIVEPHDWIMPGAFTSRSFQKAMAGHDFEMFLRGENIIYARA